MKLSNELIADVLEDLAVEVRRMAGSDGYAYALAAFERDCRAMVGFERRMRSADRARIKAEARRVLDPVSGFYVDVP